MVAFLAGVIVVGTFIVFAALLHLAGKRYAAAVLWRCAALASAVFMLYIVLEVGPGVGRMNSVYIGFAGAALFGFLLALSLNRLNKRP